MKCWRSILAMTSVSAGCLLMTGCAITRKSASIDSESRMPWFGLELATPRRKAAPETQRIRRDGSIPLEPEPAKLVTPIKSNDTLWQRLTGPEKEKPAPISIPRTDLTEAPPVPEPDDEPSPDSFDAIEF